MSKITPFLWFDTSAEEAVEFYASVFKNCKVHQMTRYFEGGPMPAGTVMTISFEINGQELVAMNGGPTYKLSPAFSLAVHCETQEEIDYYWEKLTDGGQEVQCGWLTDRFGVSWQVFPVKMFEMIGGDPATRSRVMAVVMQSVKLDIAKLEQAHRGV